MSHSQFHSIDRLYLHMHGLIFETSVWLLAGSTRLLKIVNFFRFFIKQREWLPKQSKLSFFQITEKMVSFLV